MFKRLGKKDYPQWKKYIKVDLERVQFPEEITVPYAIWKDFYGNQEFIAKGGHRALPSFYICFKNKVMTTGYASKMEAQTVTVSALYSLRLRKKKGSKQRKGAKYLPCIPSIIAFPTGVHWTYKLVFINRNTAVRASRAIPLSFFCTKYPCASIGLWNTARYPKSTR